MSYSAPNVPVMDHTYHDMAYEDHHYPAQSAVPSYDINAKDVQPWELGLVHNFLLSQQ
jgi:hypothetical protein